MCVVVVIHPTSSYGCEAYLFRILLDGIPRQDKTSSIASARMDLLNKPSVMIMKIYPFNYGFPSEVESVVGGWEGSKTPAHSTCDVSDGYLQKFSKWYPMKLSYQGYIH